jgi:signal transduction histidine kinase
MEWTTVGPVVLAVLSTFGVAELLKLVATRRSRRMTDTKVRADTEAVISSELRQWTTQAEARAERAERRAEKAELRADETESRLKERIEDLGVQLEAMRHDVERMRVLIRDCTAGPPCPVRIAIDRVAS